MPGGLQLVLILPDGSKSLIPADWTDYQTTSCTPQPLPLVGSLDDLWRLRLVDALLRRAADLSLRSGATQEGHAATDSELSRHPDSGDAPVGAFDDHSHCRGKRTTHLPIPTYRLAATLGFFRSDWGVMRSGGVPSPVRG